jgi:hypothetical protein
LCLKRGDEIAKGNIRQGKIDKTRKYNVFGMKIDLSILKSTF